MVNFIKPQNLEEKLICYSIVGTYGLYFLGLQSIWIPALAWFLTLYLCKKVWHQTAYTPSEEKIIVPASVWVWILCMSVMLFTLLMARIDLELGVLKLISALRDWTMVWSLMALFPLVGCLNIRPQLIYRAACILSTQSLAFSLASYLMYVLHIPSFEYVSPVWSIMHGSRGDYFVHLYEVTGPEFRLSLFTSTPNALGVVGSVYFYLALQEHDKKWRWIGMIGAAAMVMGSASRMTTLCIFLVPTLTWILTNFGWRLQTIAGLTSFFAGIFAPALIDFVNTTWNSVIKGYRSSSEVVRSRLKQIALDRWQETPLWGHGPILEKGPKTTEFIPIGSHNQWPDLLYNEGLVGFSVFLIPWIWSFIDLLVKAQKSQTAKAALSVLIGLLISTSGGDIETAAFMYYPGLVLLGTAFKEEVPVSSKQNYDLVNS